MNADPVPQPVAKRLLRKDDGGCEGDNCHGYGIVWIVSRFCKTFSWGLNTSRINSSPESTLEFQSLGAPRVHPSFSRVTL